MISRGSGDRHGLDTEQVRRQPSFDSYCLSNMQTGVRWYDLSATSASYVEVILMPQPLKELGLQVQYESPGLMHLAHPSDVTLVFDSHASTFQVAGITGVHHHTQLIFVFVEKTGFHHVGKAGLELLTSSHQLASASQSAEIIGGSYCVLLRLPVKLLVSLTSPSLTGINLIAGDGAVAAGETVTVTEEQHARRAV
ncbi:hypothetical protein AAY473_005472 [Plecturocebus cupreus]